MSIRHTEQREGEAEDCGKSKTKNNFMKFIWNNRCLGQTKTNKGDKVTKAETNVIQMIKNDELWCLWL